MSLNKFSNKGLTHLQLEMPDYVLSNVDADVLVLKHHVISILSAD